MKKNGILNSSISRVLSDMGHTDIICICDAGLPIPMNIEKIDLSLRDGVPSFIDVLREVVNDMHIERVYLAIEIKDKNKEILNEINNLMKNTDIVFVTHQEFKNMTVQSRCIIRTGEITPYANIILESGVYF